MNRIPLLSSAAAFCLCATILPAQETQPAAAAEPPVIRIVPHDVWSDIAPKGVPADGIRRNLAPGDSMTFGEITITSGEWTGGVPDAVEPAAQVDRVELTLSAGDETETRTVAEGDAFNWKDWHVSVVAIYATKGDLGYGSTVMEVATIESLPEEVAQSATANGAEHRLRVPHTLDKLTLHHSATALNPGDDLAQKLRNMQAWGERDRNWWDIPYHFIIDLDGTVYEGRDYRYVGDTNTRYNPTGHFLVNCYGNYNEAEPNEAQLETITNLFAWASAEYGIPPTAMYGHGDLAQTTCPGENLQTLIDNGTLQARVAKVLETGAPKMEWVEE